MGSLLVWGNSVAGSKRIPLPLTLKGRLAEWLNFNGSARSRPVPGSPLRTLLGLYLAAVPTFVTVTVSIPCPTLSMSSRILSPTAMLEIEAVMR